MFYEDIEIGSVAELGETVFTREAILAYARRFDFRIVDASPLFASGLHVASAAMRRIVDHREAARAAAGGDVSGLGVSPGFRLMRWPNPVAAGDVVRFSIATVSKRMTSKPGMGLVGLETRGVNQRGEQALSFSSVVLVACRDGAG